MDYIILIFIDLALILELYIKVKVAITYAGTPSFGHFGTNPEGRQSSIENRFGLGMILPRLLLIGFLSLVIYTIYKKGHQPNQIYSKIINEDVPAAQLPETELPKPYLGDDGEMVVDNRYREMKISDSAPAGEKFWSTSGNTITSENTLPESSLKELETIEPPRNFREVEREIPVGGSKFWLQIVTRSEQEAYEQIAYYQDLVEDAKLFSAPEQHRHRVRLGPFSTESEARDFRDNFGCSCQIIPE